MAMIKCQECGKDISDKAVSCPNCGCPVSYSVKESTNDNQFEEYNSNIVNENNELIRKTDTSDKIKSKKKNSVLSFIAFLFSFFGFGIISIFGAIFAIIDLKSNDKNKNHDLSIAAIIIMIVWWFLIALLIHSANDNDNQNTTENITTEQTIAQDNNTTNDNEEVTEKEVTFEDELKGLLGEETGDNLLKILKDDIGFTELSNIEKVDDTLNYKVNANGYEITVTEISDTDFRVIIPNTDYVFYEENKVVLTYEEFSKRTINEDNITFYFVYAEEMVEPCLKNAKSAKFCSSGEALYKRYDNIVEVRGTVTAKNDFNAKVTENWVVQFMTDENASQYVPMYIKIGDNESGEYTELD